MINIYCFKLLILGTIYYAAMDNNKMFNSFDYWLSSCKEYTSGVIIIQYILEGRKKDWKLAVPSESF